MASMIMNWNFLRMKLKFCKKKEPYALDRKIWNELQKQGLTILNGDGNYLDQIF